MRGVCLTGEWGGADCFVTSGVGVKCSNGGSVRTCKRQLPHRRVSWGRLADAGMEPERVLLARSLRGGVAGHKVLPQDIP